MKFNIVPYVGAGPLKFGMQQSEAVSVLGAPSLVLKNPNSDVTVLTNCWKNNGLQLDFDAERDALVSISFYSNIDNIELDGVFFDWENSSKIYKDLVKNDPSAKIAVGITVFFKKGISVSGLESNDLSTKSLTVFSHGQFDPEDPDFKPVSVK